MKNSVKTGGLSAASVLAAGTGAYAAIVPITPPANVPNAAAPNSNPGVGAIAFDVTGDGTNDFGLQFRNSQAAGTGVIWQANFSPFTAAGTAAVLGFAGPFIPYGANLATGITIGATTPVGLSWRNQAQVTLGSNYRSGGIVSPYGGFGTGPGPGQVATQPGGAGRPAGARGFLGIRFTVLGATRYGWLDVEVRPATSAAGSGGIFFYGGAYEDSGAPIGAGVPTPGAVTAMALGAAGLLRRNRRA